MTPEERAKEYGQAVSNEIRRIRKDEDETYAPGYGTIARDAFLAGAVEERVECAKIADEILGDYSERRSEEQPHDNHLWSAYDGACDAAREILEAIRERK